MKLPGIQLPGAACHTLTGAKVRKGRQAVNIFDAGNSCTDDSPYPGATARCELQLAGVPPCEDSWP